jgi:hypothetical protein
VGVCGVFARKENHMIRKFVGLLALLLVAVFSMADEDKKDAKKVEYTTVIGDFESYKNETMILKVKAQEKEFKVPGDTLVGYVVGEGKTKVVKARDYLKDVKRGSIVSVSLTPDGKTVLALGVTEAPKQKPKDDKEKEK